MSNLVADDDPRLGGNFTAVPGLTLFHRPYTRWSESCDHDHCDYCWRTFAEVDAGVANAVHQGWAPEDNYTWVCEACFADFRDRFQWIEGDPTAPVKPRS